MHHLIFDTETTGLPKSFSAPMSDANNWPRLVSLSWILSDGTNQEEFNYIIKPEGFEIPPEVTKIHGISQEMALREGRDLRLVLSIFSAFLRLSSHLVAHNISFDKNIIGAEYHRLGHGPGFENILKDKTEFCTMKKANGILNQRGIKLESSKWPKLIELHKTLFKKGFTGAHNSLSDTKACARCYFELIKQ